MAVYKRDAAGKIIDSEAKRRKRKGGNKASEAHGVWWYDFMVKGRRYKQATTATNIQEARLEEAKALVEVAEGRWGKPPQQTLFADFVNDVYLKWARQHKRSHRWDETQTKILCRHFKGRVLREIASADIEAYILERRETITYRGKQRAGSSVNRERALLSVIFSLAVKHGYCEENPCAKVGRFKEEGRRERVLTFKEEESLFKALYAAGERMHAIAQIAAVALGTGMRCGELLALCWTDIDFEEGFINVRRETTKNGKARVVPLSAATRAVLASLHTDKSKGRIFPLSSNAVSQRFAKFCDKLGLPDVTLHTLRHTFTSRLASLGVPPTTIKAIVGHSNLMMTTYYTHVSSADLQKAVKSLEKTPFCAEIVPTQANSEAVCSGNSLQTSV